MVRPNAQIARSALIVGWVVCCATTAAAQPSIADLAVARSLYNQRKFDEAITAAIAARQVPDVADTAAIVLARAYLERYRERSDPADLSAAREVLGAIRAAHLELRDQVELMLALGQ